MSLLPKDYLCSKVTMIGKRWKKIGDSIWGSRKIYRKLMYMAKLRKLRRGVKLPIIQKMEMKKERMMELILRPWWKLKIKKRLLKTSKKWLRLLQCQRLLNNNRRSRLLQSKRLKKIKRWYKLVKVNRLSKLLKTVNNPRENKSQ